MPGAAATICGVSSANGCPIKLRQIDGYAAMCKGTTKMNDGNDILGTSDVKSPQSSHAGAAQRTSLARASPNDVVGQCHDGYPLLQRTRVSDLVGVDACR